MSEFKNKRMENACYWAAQLEGWLIDGPNTVADRCTVEVEAGQPILVMDDSFNEELVKAMKDGLLEYGFPRDLTVRDLTDRYDEWRIFMFPTDDRLKSNWDDSWREWKDW